MQTGLAQFVRNVLLIVGALFPIVNPLGNVPIFLTLTAGFTSAMRTVLARKIALNGFVLLVGSILIGTNILAFFGISLPVVQVGGGMVVIATAWGLLNRRDDQDGRPDSKHSASASDPLSPRLLSVDAAADGGAGLDLGGDHCRSQSSSRCRIQLVLSGGCDPGRDCGRDHHLFQLPFRAIARPRSG